MIPYRVRWVFALIIVVGGADPLWSLSFQRHTIDTFPGGYQVAVADINGDGRPDVIALSTNANRVDWYENPTWKMHPVARTAANIDIAPRDIDGDGKIEIALASGFYFNESSRGGEIQWLKPPAKSAQPDSLWEIHPIAVDPVTHRLRWGDLDGDGRAELVHAPLFGRGSKGAVDPKPAHLWAFRLQSKIQNLKSKIESPAEPPAIQPWKIDETLTVLHGIYVGDLDGDGRDEILTASFEGIHRYDWEGEGSAASWKKAPIARGAEPKNQKPGTARGSSEVAPGRLGKNNSAFIAAIEPWHGKEVVVYTQAKSGAAWTRRILDDTLEEGHALVVADLDGDGVDEIVAGWRGGKGGLVLFDSSDLSDRSDSSDKKWTRIPLDEGIAVEGAVATDINGDGRLDLVAIAGRSNLLVWYENLGRGSR
jgi:hypothetical protein